MSELDGIAIGLPAARRQINKQHRRLAALVARVERSISQGHNPKRIVKLLDRLITAAEAHFSYEAYVQNSLGLGDTAFHSGSNVRPDKLRELRDEYAANRPPQTLKALSTLAEWLKLHYPKTQHEHHRFADSLRDLCEEGSFTE